MFFPHRYICTGVYKKNTFLVGMEKAEVQYVLNGYPIPVNIYNKMMTMLYNNIKLKRKKYTFYYYLIQLNL